MENSKYDDLLKFISKNYQIIKERKDTFNCNIINQYSTLIERRNSLSEQDIENFLIITIETLNIKSNPSIIDNSLKIIELLITHKLLNGERMQRYIILIEKKFFIIYENYSTNEKIICKIINLLLIMCSSDNIKIQNENYYNIITFLIHCFINTNIIQVKNITKVIFDEIINNIITKAKLQSENNLYKNNNNNNNISEINVYIDNILLKNERDEYLKKFMKYAVDIIESGLYMHYGNDIEAYFTMNKNNNKRLNEKGIENGLYDWCTLCRNQAMFYSIKLQLPICSNECEEKIEKLLYWTNINISYKSTYDIYDDYINIIQLLSFCAYKFLPKNDNVINDNFEEINLFCFEYIYKLLLNYTKPNDKMIKVCSDVLFPCLIANGLNLEIFESSQRFFGIFILLVKNKYYRKLLMKEIMLYIEKVVIYLIKSTCYEERESLLLYKEELLSSLVNASENSLEFFIEIFHYCDCDVNYSDVYSEFINCLIREIRVPYDENYITIKNNSIELMNKMINNLLYETEKALQRKNCNIDNEEMNKAIIFKALLKKGVEKFNLNSLHIIKFLIDNNLIINESNFNKYKQIYQNNINDEQNENDDIIKVYYSQRLQNNYIKYPFPISSNNTIQNIINCFLSKYYDGNKVITYEDFTAYQMCFFIRCNVNILNKSELAKYICKTTPFHLKLLTYYIESYSYFNYHIVEALHLLLDGLPLVNEAQITERVLRIFASKYCEDNKFKEQKDFIYHISTLIIKLSSCVINEQIAIPPMREYIEKMKSFTYNKNEFSYHKDPSNYSYICDIYNRVLAWPIRIIINDNEDNINSSCIDKGERKITLSDNIIKELICYNNINIRNKDVYIIEITLQDIKVLIQRIWGDIFGIFSLLIKQYDEEEILKHSADNLYSLIKIAGKLSLTTISESCTDLICKLTHIDEKKPLSAMDIRCIIMITDLLKENGVYFSSTLYNMLLIISKINYFQSTTFEQYANSTDSEDKKIFYYKKEKLQSIQLDGIYSNTINLPFTFFEIFISSLCKVSNYELNAYHKDYRTFSLRKLVDCCEYNVTIRSEVELLKIFKIASDYLINIIILYSINNISICEIGIETLEQIVLKLLNKREISLNSNFQVSLLLPFELIYNRANEKSDLCEKIMVSLRKVVESSKNIKSGWIVLFQLIKCGLMGANGKIYEEIIKILKATEKEIESNIEDIESYHGYMECLCMMFTVDSVKSTVKDTLIQLIRYIASNAPKAQKFKTIKMFIYSFDDIIRVNPYTYMGLLFDVIEGSKDCLYSINKKEEGNKEKEENFIFCYYSFFKPHLVCLLFYHFANRFNVKEYKSPDCLKKNKLSNDELFENACVFLKETLNEQTPKMSSEIYSNLYEDKDYFAKKIGLLNDITQTQYEISLEIYMDKFLNMVQREKNYIPYYEDLYQTFLRGSVYNKDHKICFDILSKNYNTNIQTYKIEKWKVVKGEFNYILSLLSSLNEDEITEDQMKHIISYTYCFANFFSKSVEFYSSKEENEIAMIEEYKKINVIIINFINIDIKSKINIISSKNAMEIIMIMSKMKMSFIKNRPINIKDFYDKSSIELIDSLSKIYMKYSEGEGKEIEEINELIIPEVEFVLPRILNYLNQEELIRVFEIVLNLLQCNNENIRTAAKIIIQSYQNKKLYYFASKEVNDT